ncbi:MAG: DUF4123 domain-containing protein [Halobacteriota archaeon]
MFEKLARQNSSLRWFAIADSAQHRALPNAIAEENYQVRCLFGASPDSPVAQHVPHLVELSSPLQGSPSWSWISLHSKKIPCVTVIATEKSFDTTFSQLTGCLEAVLPDGDAMFFAFWDPAILGTLVGQEDDETLHVRGPVLTPGQRSMLTSGMQAWWYWDRAGNLHALQTDDTGSAPALPPLTLSQTQVDDLVEASVPDHVLYYLQLNQPFLIDGIPYLQQYKVVRDTMKEARDTGLNSMRDLVNFICMKLIYGDRMHTDVFIRALLDKVQRGELTFEKALEAFP